MSSTRADFDDGPLHEVTRRVPTDDGPLPNLVVVEDDDSFVSVYVLGLDECTYRYDGAATDEEAARCPRIKA